MIRCCLLAFDVTALLRHFRLEKELELEVDLTARSVLHFPPTINQACTVI